MYRQEDPTTLWKALLKKRPCTTSLAQHRWTASCYNTQPAYFLWAQRLTKHWQAFFDLLVPLNQSWCKNASILVVVLSATHFDLKGHKQDGKPNPTHFIETGLAMQTFSLVATSLKIVTHIMAGFNAEKAYQTLGIPRDKYKIAAMIAVGKRGDSRLLDSYRRQLDEQQRTRKPVSEMSHEGIFPK